MSSYKIRLENEQFSICLLNRQQFCFTSSTVSLVVIRCSFDYNFSARNSITIIISQGNSVNNNNNNDNNSSNNGCSSNNDNNNNNNNSNSRSPTIIVIIIIVIIIIIIIIITTTTVMTTIIIPTTDITTTSIIINTIPLRLLGGHSDQRRDLQQRAHSRRPGPQPPLLIS